MNKGNAIVMSVFSFLLGGALVWGITNGKGPSVGPDVVATAGDTSPIAITKEDPQWGNAAAPVTIVEISDFQCPFCSRVVPTIAQIKQEYGPDKVRIVWKNNPLPFHKDARPAHDAAVTVQALGGDFWKFHDQAFANQSALNPENFQKWAVEAGVDAAKFKTAYDAKTYAPKVDKDMALAAEIGARGTPAFRINGKTLSGAQPLPKFKQLIDEQIAEADKLIQSGVAKNKVSAELTKKNFTKAEPPPPAEAQQQPPEDKSIWKIPVADSDPVRGGKDALVTIVMWSDFQCPFCSRVEATLKQVADEYKDDVRIVWKDNPLPFHNRARPAAALARFAYETKGNEGFWRAHDEMFANQQNLEDEGLKAVAEKVGLNWAKAKAAIDSNKYNARLDESTDLAAEFEARGTPHFFVNGRRLSGAQPYEKFKALIEEQKAIAKGVVDKGVPRAKVYDELMKTAKAPPPPEKKEVPAPTAENPFKGPANAKIVIQEFSDFQCPFCSRVGPTVEQVLKEYPNDVKVVWRNLPLPFHQDAPLAAEAAYEAFKQGGNKAFWAFHDKLFANQKALSRTDLENYAKELNLNLDQFKQALDSRKHQAFVESEAKLAQQIGIGGTPGFTVNGYFISGAQPFQEFSKMIKLALKGS
jgi:protein-disulfide isomerase